MNKTQHSKKITKYKIQSKSLKNQTLSKKIIYKK